MLEILRLTDSKSADGPPKERFFHRLIRHSPKNMAKVVDSPKNASPDPRKQALERLFDPDLSMILNDTRPSYLQANQTALARDFESLLRWMTEPNSLRDNLQHDKWPLWIHLAFHELHGLLERHSLLLVDNESTTVLALGPSSVEAQDKIASYNAPFLTRKSISLGIVLRPVGERGFSSFGTPMGNKTVYKIIGPCFMLATSEPTSLIWPPTASEEAVQII
jgi:hypothetical protein